MSRAVCTNGVYKSLTLYMNRWAEYVFPPRVVASQYAKQSCGRSMKRPMIWERLPTYSSNDSTGDLLAVESNILEKKLTICLSHYGVSGDQM